MSDKILGKIKKATRPAVRFWGFLKEVRFQMKKIDWPSKEEAFSYTAIVIFSVLLLAVFLGGVDFLLVAILDKVIL